MMEARGIMKKKIRKPKCSTRHPDIGSKDGGIAEFRVTYVVLDVHSNTLSQTVHPSSEKNL